MSEIAGEKTNPIAAVLPLAIIVGILGLFLTTYFGEIGEETFIPFASTVALFVYILTFIDIRIGLAALFLTIGMSPELTIGEVSNVRLEDFVVPVIFIAWITRLIEKREEFAPTVLKAPIILYIVVAIVASLLGITAETTKPTRCFMVFGKTVEYFIIFLIVLNNIKSEKDAKAFIIMAIIIAIISSFRSLTTYEIEKETIRATRVMGPPGETANILAGYIIMNMGITVGLFLSLQNIRYRLLLGLIFFFLLYTLMFTFSRTGYAALALGLIFFGIIKKRQVLFVVLVALIAFPLIAPPEVANRAMTISNVPTQDQPESWKARVAAWNESIDVVISSPLFGKGLGSVNLADTDNEYVKVAREMGILGLLVFVWLMVKIGIQAFFAYNNVTYDKFIHGYIAGYLIAFLSILIHAMGATSFTSIRTMETFMLLTGIFVAIVNNYQEWEKEAKHAITPENIEYAATKGKKVSWTT